MVTIKADKNDNEVQAHELPMYMYSISNELYINVQYKETPNATSVALPVEEMSSCWRSAASPSVTVPLNKVEISAPHFSVGLAVHL